MDNYYAVRADVVIDSLVIPNTTMIEYHLKEQSELATLVLKPIAHEKGHLLLNCDFECITDMSYWSRYLQYIKCVISCGSANL
jgi:hypothetical protein